MNVLFSNLESDEQLLYVGEVLRLLQSITKEEKMLSLPGFCIKDGLDPYIHLTRLGITKGTR